MWFFPLDGAVKHIAHHTAGKEREQLPFLQEALHGLLFVSTVLWFVLLCQKRHAEFMSVRHDNTSSFPFPLLKKEKTDWRWIPALVLLMAQMEKQSDKIIWDTVVGKWVCRGSNSCLSPKETTDTAESIKPVFPPHPSILHPQLHGSQTSALYRADRPVPKCSACSQVTEIRPVMLEQMSSVSLAPILVCLLPRPVSCFHSTKWLVSHHNPLCGEDKGTLWSNAPKHLIKSPLPLSSSWGSAGSPCCRRLLMWSCLKPSSVTPMRRLAGLN